MLPDISYSYTVNEALSLNLSGEWPTLQARVLSTDLHVSQLGIIANSFLIGIISDGLGGIALLGGEIAAATADPKKPGVGSSLAASWPTDSLISKPIVAKVIFAWTNLTVDATGVRTRGHLPIVSRSPAGEDCRADSALVRGCSSPAPLQPTRLSSRIFARRRRSSCGAGRRRNRPRGQGHIRCRGCLFT